MTWTISLRLLRALQLGPILSLLPMRLEYPIYHLLNLPSISLTPVEPPHLAHLTTLDPYIDLRSHLHRSIAREFNTSHHFALPLLHFRPVLKQARRGLVNARGEKRRSRNPESLFRTMTKRSRCIRCEKCPHPHHSHLNRHNCARSLRRLWTDNNGVGKLSKLQGGSKRMKGGYTIVSSIRLLILRLDSALPLAGTRSEPMRVCVQ